VYPPASVELFCGICFQGTWHPEERDVLVVSAFFPVSQYCLCGWSHSLPMLPCLSRLQSHLTHISWPKLLCARHWAFMVGFHCKL